MIAETIPQQEAYGHLTTPQPETAGIDNERIAEYQTRYMTDSALLPLLAEEQGIKLDGSIVRTLHGEYQYGDHYTTGFGKATIILGQAINQAKKPNSLFDADSHQPSAKKLAALAENPYGGEAGRVFYGMMHDIVQPYQKQSDDGFVGLQPRGPEMAYRVNNYTNYGQRSTAKFCSNAEYHFDKGMANRGLQPIEVDGETVALFKTKGDHTAILIKPAVLNGVRIPVGSIMTVEGSLEEGYKFGFGRLSAWSLKEPAEAKAEFATILSHEGGDVQKYFDTTNDRFNRLVDQDAPSSSSAVAVQEYAERHQLRDWNEAREGLLAEVAEAIKDDKVYKIMAGLSQTAEHVAEQKVQDEAALRDPSMPMGNSKRMVDDLLNRRLMIVKMYGQDAIIRARRLDYLQRSLQAS